MESRMNEVGSTAIRIGESVVSETANPYGRTRRSTSTNTTSSSIACGKTSSRTTLTVSLLFDISEGLLCLSNVEMETVPDPDSAPAKSEQGLEELFDEIRATVDTETQIVKAVFPNPPVVMQVFLQRVFAQSNSSYTKQPIYPTCLSAHDPACPRTAVRAGRRPQALRPAVHRAPTPNEVAEFRRTFSDAVPSVPAGSSSSVSAMLETAMEELFVPYTEGQRYLERESRSLGFLYSTLLAQFTRYQYVFPSTRPASSHATYRSEHIKAKPLCLTGSWTTQRRCCNDVRRRRLDDLCTGCAAIMRLVVSRLTVARRTIPSEKKTVFSE
ncbi:Exocyst complex component [Salix suchowensis]|nr:Exocyst complex component [Salix suchowensis]